MVKPKRYVVRFVHRKTRSPRAYMVYAYSKLDADVEGLRRLRTDEASPTPGLPADWMSYGAEIDKVARRGAPR